MPYIKEIYFLFNRTRPVFLLFFLYWLIFPHTLPGQCDGVRLNEIHYDNISADSMEFIELALPADSVSDLSPYVVYLYNGSSGSFYDSIGLNSFIPGNADSIYEYYTWLPSSIQNGAPDGFALAKDTLVCEFLSYEGSFVATDGPAANLTSVDILVSEDNNTAPGHSLQLIGGSWSGPMDATPGETNHLDQCIIDSLEIINDSCTGPDLHFEVGFNVQSGSGQYEVIDESNSNMILASGDSIPIQVIIDNHSDTSLMLIRVRDMQDTSCVSAPVAFSPPSCLEPPDCVNIELNEIHYDNMGSDSFEFVEIKLDAGIQSGLENYIVDLYNGSSGTIYDSESLNNFVSGSQDSAYHYYYWLPASIQNGAPDGLSLSAGDSLCEFISYEGEFMAVEGPAVDSFSTDLSVWESGADSTGYSLQKQGVNWFGPLPWSAGQENQVEQCDIYNLAVVGDSCIAYEYNLNLSYEYENGSGQVELIDVSDNTVLAEGNASPLSIDLDSTYFLDSLTVVLRDSSDHLCISDSLIIIIPSCACPALWNLAGTINSDEIYLTSGQIISGQIIESSANVIYDAAGIIELNHPFEVKQGAVFHALNEGCEGL